MKVVWRVRALSDVSRITRHIAFDNPPAASRIARELLLTGDSLEIFPLRVRPGRRPDTRELVGVGPYVIVYRVELDAVTILSVWHGARDRN